ncbi:hypothetical protein KUL113_04120 [Tenacibaculum sp. KUL113]|nr:hypothetical protein KUL113_04120 [Tenacibaculum sp. KUL113]
MAQNMRADYLLKLRRVQAQLSKIRDLGSSANFETLLKDIDEANTIAGALGIEEPYPDNLIGEIKAMQDRLTRYQQTGLDVPSLGNVVKH